MMRERRDRYHRRNEPSQCEMLNFHSAISIEAIWFVTNREGAEHYSRCLKSLAYVKRPALVEAGLAELRDVSASRRSHSYAPIPCQSGRGATSCEREPHSERNYRTLFCKSRIGLRHNPADEFAVTS